MRYEQVRTILLQQWTYTGGAHEDKASEFYHDDVVLEFPQSDEWFRGKATQQAWRERYPAQLEFRPQEIRGSGDLWIAEGTLSYDGTNTLHYIKIDPVSRRQDRSRDDLLRRAVRRRPSGADPGWRRSTAAAAQRPTRTHRERQLTRLAGEPTCGTLEELDTPRVAPCTRT